MTVIKGPGELVAAVPAILGFAPRESVVVVPVRDGGGVGMVLRADRADLLGADGAEFARRIAHHMARESASVTMVIGFTQESVRDGCPALALLQEALEDTVARVEIWAVRDGRYFSPGCDDTGCCPREGREVPAPPGPVRPVLRERASQEDRRRAARAARRGECACAQDPERFRPRALALWRRAIVRGPGEPPELGRLAAGLADVRVRDAALVAMLPDADAAAQDALEGRDTPALARALGSRLRPVEAPDAFTALIARDVLLDVVRHLEGERAAPAAAMLGVLSWWEGDGAHALGWCLQALEWDPCYRLAMLVVALIETSGRPPMAIAPSARR